MKNKISRKIGIPLTKGGRERKVGKMLGCCITFIAFIVSLLFISSVIYALVK